MQKQVYLHFASEIPSEVEAVKMMMVGIFVFEEVILRSCHLSGGMPVGYSGGLCVRYENRGYRIAVTPGGKTGKTPLIVNGYFACRSDISDYTVGFSDHFDLESTVFFTVDEAVNAERNL